MTSSSVYGPEDAVSGPPKGWSDDLIQVAGTQPVNLANLWEGLYVAVGRLLPSII